MKTKYVSKFFTGSLLASLMLLVLLGISATRANGQTHVDGNPTCADINADDANFPSITSDNGFSTNNAPPSGMHTYNIAGVGNIKVTYNSDTDIRFAASSKFVTAVIVKAADGADVYIYNPSAMNGGPLATPLKNGKNAGLSHLVFCYDVSLAPTAATAMVAGRVTTNNVGRIRGAVLVSILNTATLETQAVFTNKLGYYQFDNLQVGDTYVLTVRSKGFTFTPQTFTLSDDSALDLFGTAVERSGSKEDTRFGRAF